MLTGTPADLDRKVFRRRWGILQDPDLDRRGPAPAAAQGTAGGAQHRVGHCGDTVVYSTGGPEAWDTASAGD